MRLAAAAAAAVLLAPSACGTPKPAPIANTGAGDGASPCTVDRATPEGLACAVYVALRSGNEGAYAQLVLQDPADYAELGKLMDHPPDPPSPAERDQDLARARARLTETTAQLRARKLDPPTMALVETKTDEAVVRGDVGIAEDLTIVVRSNGVTVPVTIDDVAFLRGRWVILDGLKLRE